MAAVAVLYKRRQVAFAFKDGAPLPPGPPARWFWDSAMPAVNIAHTLTDWIAEYGPVITLRQGSQVIIIIGRVDAAAEIMEKEGAALVDRPRSIPADELLSRGMRILVAGSGDRFRRLRRAIHTHFQPKAVESYRGVQFDSARNVIVDILNDPKNHQAHVRRYAASVILRVTYGKSSPTSTNDPEVIRIYQVLRNLQAAMRPGAHLVERVPLLKYIPGYGSRLKQWHEFELKLYREQLDRVKRGMLANDGGESFVRTLLENTDSHRLSTDEMSYLAGNLFGAGSDTTAVGITTMIMAAACHPEAQRRVQEELDMVVGMDRTPTWEDSSSLPQLQAFISEALRWRPITPFGFNHRATKDIIWRGQCIPAGATVLGCHWAISRDPVAFPDPERFDPQRWFDRDGKLLSDVRFYTYGFGRRICPGLYLANQSLYINLALILWSFRIAQCPDAPIDTSAYTDTMISHAAPFEVEFMPRMEERRLREMVDWSSA
ncbi:cytochrome P450 [Gyrodon lividus]|nr:cytochrome P450 [Gyrodon lividus]